MFARLKLRAAFTAALAAFWLVLPLLAGAHASHAHRYCAEHRTIEEGGAVGVRAAEAADPTQEGPAVEPADDLGSEGGAHEECLVLAAQARSATVSESPGFAAERLPCSLYAQLSAGLPPQQIALLAVAPKSSPPGC